MINLKNLLKITVCSATLIGAGLFLVNDSESVQAAGMQVELAQDGQIINLSEIDKYQGKFDGVGFLLHILQDHEFAVNEEEVWLYKQDADGKNHYFRVGEDDQPVEIPNIHDTDLPIGATNLFTVPFANFAENGGNIPKSALSLAGSINLFDPNPETVAQLPVAEQTRHGFAFNEHFRLEVHQLRANARLIVVCPTPRSGAIADGDLPILARTLDMFNGHAEEEPTPWSLEAACNLIPTLRNQNQASVYIGAVGNLHFSGNLVATVNGNVDVAGLQRLLQAGLLAEHAPEASARRDEKFIHEVEDVVDNVGRHRRKVVFRPVVGAGEITEADQTEIARLLDADNAHYRARGNANWHEICAGKIVDALKQGKSPVYYGPISNLRFCGFEGVMDDRRG